MPGIRKVKRNKSFKTHINRKKLATKLNNPGKIHCGPISRAWNYKRSVANNLKDMGLAHDSNKVIPIPNHKKQITKEAIAMIKNPNQMIVDDEPEPEIKSIAPKISVMERIEAIANAPRPRRFAISNGQVELISYFLDKHGHDYKAMAKDSKNHWQETWKQLRAKVKTFMGVPEQYRKYLADRGLLDKDDESTMENYAETFVNDDSD